MKPRQQGDVFFHPVKEVPTAKKLAHTVVAYGEHTGHKHQVFGEDVELCQDEAGTLWLSAPNGGTVKHEEHKPVELKPGKYKIGIVKEYDHFAEEAREVRD